MHTYTALFDDRLEAEKVQSELQALGIVPVENVNVSGKDTNGFVADRKSDNRSFWQSLKDVFVSDDDRPVYEEGVRQGGWLLTVNVDDANTERVHELLERSNAVDVDEREARFRKDGQLPASDAASSVPVIREELRVGKRRIEQGGVRVRSYVVERPVEETVKLREERVVVERKSVDKPLTATEVANAFQDRDLEVRATKEEPVVAKEARVVEEVVVEKNVGERVAHIEETVRHTEVDVERIDREGKGKMDPSDR